MAIKKGIYAASMSIFKEDLSLDIDSTIKHSEKLIEKVFMALFSSVPLDVHNLSLLMRRNN